MPVRVLRVLAAVGDEVERQQGLVLLETIKTQNELTSPKQGRVARIVDEIGARLRLETFLSWSNNLPEAQV